MLFFVMRARKTDGIVGVVVFKAHIVFVVGLGQLRLIFDQLADAKVPLINFFGIFLAVFVLQRALLELILLELQIRHLRVVIVRHV